MGTEELPACVHDELQCSCPHSPHFQPVTLQLKGCLGSLCTFSSYFSILIYMAGPSSFGMAQANVLDM